MGIRKLGYVGLDVTDVAAWAGLLGPILGIGVNSAKAGSEEVTLAELDELKYRLALYPSASDATRHIGWIVDTAAEQDRLTSRLEDAGYAICPASAEDAALRGATDVRWFTDPAGYRIELALGQAKVRAKAARPADASPGVTGLGHFVLACPQRDEVRDLYERVLEFKLTDYRDPGLYFLRCNSSHHSVALGYADVASIHHLEFEHGSLDDVGRAHDRARAAGVPISISLGRHMNDKAISFYVRNPSGFHLEIGCGSIHVGDDWTPHDFGFADVWGHEHAEANPFAHPTDRREAPGAG